MNLNRWFIAFLLWSWLQPGNLLACRYNVRDVGFVDLETEHYHLYAFVRHDTPADLVSTFKKLSSSLLSESNVTTEVVDVDQQKDHAALKHLSREASASALAAILVSPDGQTLPIALLKQGEPFREILTAALREIVSSPTRDEIVRTVSVAFGAVLLIEGENAEANSRARHAIAKAIDEIRAQMKLMPKAIAQPPIMIVLEAAALARERVLLWSLGLDARSAAQPRAAIVYGRARWIGPLMKGDEITERNLTGILSIIGADCECTLDISWTQGTRLPVRWVEGLHAQLTKSLGFDPESPLVKFEVSRILGRRGLAKAAPSGYREVALDGEPEATAKEPGPVADARETKQAAPILAESAPVLNRLFLGVAVLVFLAVSGGLFVVWRARSRKTE